MNSIDVIVPIYKGKAELQRCLQSVVDSNNASPYELILINDASPEPELVIFIEEFCREHPQITLLHNAKNLGFVHTVNRGMALHPDRDVLLLNSDTEVANDWLDRIIACGNSEPDIATVTPFSNNATICSFPEFPQVNELPSGHTTESLDLVFKAGNSGRHVDIPTGVGFCMWISRAALDEVGLFDAESFPRGYGEENDFCRRAAFRKWRNLLCCDVFVFHQGGVSFSSETAALTQNAEKVIDRLHPDYHQLIQEHIALDPARVFRLNIAIQLLHQSSRRKILAVTHQMGGGITKHIQDLGNYLEAEAQFLMLRPINTETIALYLDVTHATQVITFRIPEKLPQLQQCLQYIGIDRLHFHHALEIQESIWELSAALDLPYDITLHDHYFINGNPAQCDSKGYYCDELDAQSQPFELPMPLQSWQALQQQHLQNADRILCPSEFTAGLYQKYFSNLDITTVFHPDWERHAPYPATVAPTLGKSDTLRVLVLGALSMEKGADILEQAAITANADGLPLEFHLLGYGYRPLSRLIKEHGAYEHAEVNELIADISPQLIWFPALIPETFSYTLSEALTTGLPVMASDIGAFPQRITGRPRTWLVPWKNSIQQWLSALMDARSDIEDASNTGQSTPWESQQLPTRKYYLDDYLAFESTASASEGDPVDLEWLGRIFADTPAIQASQELLGRKEALLRRLFRLRGSSIGRLVSRLIPFELQRYIKRKLSKRPLHEINK